MRSPAVPNAILLLALAVSTGASAQLNAKADPATVAADDSTLTLPEAAAVLRVDAGVVRRLAENQQIPARRVEADWRFSRAALMAWLAGDWRIRTLIDPATVLAEAVKGASGTGQPAWQDSALSADASSTIAGRGPASADVSVAQADRMAQIGVAPTQPTATEMFLRDQRILQAPKEFTLDVGLFYTRRDTPLLTQTNGAVILANAESEGFTTQVTGRFSVLRDTEVFASTSYGHQRANLYAGPDRLSRAMRSELGDVGVGLRHTLIHEGLGRPDVILSVDARIPTGETSKAIGAGVTLVKSLDPVVLFGTLGYRRTFSRAFADTTRLESKNRIDLTLGYAFALNDTLSLNTSILSTFARATAFSNARLLRSSNVSTLQLGMTARVARGIYLQPSLSYRLTGPGSGFAFGINIPFTFPSQGR